MKNSHTYINFPIGLYILLMLFASVLIVTFFAFSNDGVDSYTLSKGKMSIVLIPILFMLMIGFRTLINAKGITRLYGFVKKDGSIIGFELESETWDKLSLENVSNGIDLKNKKFIINEGKKKEKIIIDIRSKKYPKFNSTNPFLPGFNSNVPKWFYGEKYIKKYNEQLRLIYKYGKDVCMTPLQAECWYNTFGPFDQNKTDQNSVVSKKHRNI